MVNREWNNSVDYLEITPNHLSAQNNGYTSVGLD